MFRLRKFWATRPTSSAPPIRYANSDTSDCSNTHECGTRTTFTLSTGDNSLILVWEGYSNGYYGEGVSFYERDGSGSRW